MIRAVREGAALLPSILRRRALALRWLAGARGAQLALLAVGLGVPFGLPTLLDPALDRLYPPVRSEQRVFGIVAFSRMQQDPRREERNRQLTALAWAGGLAGVALLLLGHAPRAVARAGAAARAREARGDSLLARQPAASATHYEAALALETDAPREAALREKLAKARSFAARALGTDVRAELAVAHALATLVEPVEPPAAAGKRGGSGRYALRGELGRGGMGIVHRALDSVLDREVALKALPLPLMTDPELARRFRQEARLLARLGHPNIVQVYDLVEEDGRLWIAMELVGGGTLADRIGRTGALPWREAARLAAELAAGLAFAHERGVIHRDVKPLNVLLTEDGVPKLTDFGLAKLASSVHTQAGSLLGSAHYLSPEQAAGEPAGAPADVYALGVTCYEMLSGRTPFEGDTAALLAQHVSRPAPPLPALAEDLPPALRELVMAMLAKEPEARPALASVAGTLARLGRS